MKTIKTVLIAGAGTMGQQTGLLCALHGFDVIMYDLSMALLEAGLVRMKKFAPRMKRIYGFTDDDIRAGLDRIRITDSPETAAFGADLILESIPEDPVLKGNFFATFNTLCDPDTIFATNTSSLVPSMFAQASGRPDRLCALHFHDVSVTKIVDVMPHPGTSPEILKRVREFALELGQIPIVLEKEHNGYVFNNMLMAFTASALNLAAAGVAPVEEIDRAWMGIMRTETGPFGLMDAIGLETVWKITDYWAGKRNDPKAKANADFLKPFVDEGRLGLKTGKGFYTYPDPAYARPDFLTAGKPSTETSHDR
ncbi:MAG: 3-hydroxyacyl-CoA dehydrogenase [Pseudomonadota bacterium]